MRFYLNDSAAAYSPLVAKGAWDDTTNQPDIGGLQTTQSGVAATLTGTEVSATNNWDVLLATFVSDALWGNVAFKTTDTVKAILGVLESASGMNAVTHLHIWITTGNTDTVRGTLLSDSIGSTKWPTTAAGLKTGLLSLANNVNALAGDHIVVEVGYQAQNTVTTSFTGTLNFGATTPTIDLTNGDTSVVAHPSWIEFSTVFPPQVVLLGSILDTNSGTHTVTATPTGNDLIVIVTRTTGNVASTPPTDNNVNGGTYVLATDPANHSASALKNTSADLMQIFVRTVLIQGPNSTVFTHAPGTSTGGGLEVYAIRGMAKVGLSAILQVALQANQAAGTPAPVLPAIPQANNPILTSVFNATSPGGVTARTGYTRDTNAGYATPTAGADSAHLNNAEASATITWGGASATAFSSLAIEFDMSLTALSNQSDALTGGSLDTTKWYDNTQNGGTTSYDASGAHLTAPALTANGEAEIEAQQRYSAIGSGAFVQAVITQVANINAEAGMTVYQDEQGNQLQLLVINGNLIGGYIQRGTTISVSSIAYNATTMKWLRIREASGTIFWDYSADGITWTNLTSMDSPMDVSLVRSSILAFNGVSSATAEIGVFSNYNITPNTNYTKSLVDTITLTESLKRSTGRKIVLSVTLVDTLKRATAKNISMSISLTEKLTRFTGKKLNDIIYLIEHAYFALQFDGIQNYITIPNSTSLNPTSAMTLSAWVNGEYTRPGNAGAISGLVTKDISGTITNPPYEFIVVNNQIHFLITSATNVAQEVISSAVSDNQKHHLIGTFDGTNMALYVDGVLIGSHAQTDIGATTGALSIGRQKAGFARFFQGVIDNVGLWNRALTAGEISDLYKKNIFPTSGLQAQWAMNEGSGTTITDSSGNGNTGTLTGSPLPTWVKGMETLAILTGKSLHDTITLSETLRRATTRLLVNSITLIERLTRTPGKVFSDSITLIEKLKRASGKTLKETVSLIEKLKRASTRKLTATVTLIEKISKQTAKKLTATITLTETLVHLSAFYRRITEQIPIMERLQRFTTKKLIDQISLSDIVANIYKSIFQGSTPGFLRLKKGRTFLKQGKRMTTLRIKRDGIRWK